MSNLVQTNYISEMCIMNIRVAVATYMMRRCLIMTNVERNRLVSPLLSASPQKLAVNFRVTTTEGAVGEM
jgi:hypothetical protein